MPEKFIPRSEAGIRAILQTMAELAGDGKLAVVIKPRDVDAFLRGHWNYQWQPLDGQVLRTVGRMMRDLNTVGKITGACADAAVLAGAMLLCGRSRRPEWFKSAAFCAVRPPNDPAFSHVFTVADDEAGTRWRIDPTAPADADYTNWEPMALSLF